MDMRILLDTNIIIHREANHVINQNIGVLFNWLDKLKYTKCVHSITVNELQKNVNPNTFQTMQAKIANYHILQTIAPLHEDVAKVSQSIDKNDNDLNDSKLLNELYSGRVDLFLTEDKKIHQKASLLKVSDKVYRIESFLEKVISENPDFYDYKILSVKREYFGNIDLSSSFFDSFRRDYVGFDQWYNGKAGDNTKAYVCYEGNNLMAFLFLKVEDENERYGDINPPFDKKIRLKIGTFKVISNGLRIGERFLKIVFDNARRYKVDEIYVTIFDKRPELLSLISLLEKFGFIYYGKKTSASGIEKVFVRNFEKKADPSNPRLTFPWISINCNLYIVPIRPEYHTELFPDSILRTESADNFVENEPHRNAISKSYISHSLTRNLRPGDILVFYRSGGIYKGVTTTIGIVERAVTDIASLEDLIKICRKRTVLSNDELKQYWERYPKNRPFVVHFLYAFSFRKRVTLKEMLEQGVLANMDMVKTITRMDKEGFKKLISLSGI